MQLRRVSHILISTLLVSGYMGAIPNYFDPRNIIHAARDGNPYWAFDGLTTENIEEVHNSPALQVEILARVDHIVHDFEQHATAWIAASLSGKTAQEQGYFRLLSPQEIEQYYTALSLVQNAQESIHKKFIVDSLSSEDRQRLSTIIAHTKVPSKKLIGGSPFHNLTQRVQLEHLYSS